MQFKRACLKVRPTSHKKVTGRMKKMKIFSASSLEKIKCICEDRT